MPNFNTLISPGKKLFEFPRNNYLYMSHIDSFVLLPTYPESINDSMAASYQQSVPLGRSAPIFSYASSGPRQLQVSLHLHRDIMNEINKDVSNIKLRALGGVDPEVGITDDYIDVIVKQLQAIAVPKYQAESKMINPPTVSVRFGQIYIRGVVNSSVSVVSSLPLLQDDKYAIVDIAFTVSEIDPYSADTIAEQGQFRGFSRTLERRLWSK